MTPMRQKFWNKRLEENSQVYYINIHGQPVVEHHGYIQKLPSSKLFLNVQEG